ncbi:MAG: hypothetical protein EXS03_01010 [Phycisphaerales bacterium]|nr:hypothetical protein [Phycisphaerales bacterium]
MAGTAGTYELGRFSGVCAATGNPITPRSAFVAALVDRINDEGTPALLRLDYALSQWESGLRPDGLVCFWRSTAPQPGERRQELVDDETLMDMVQRMSDDSDQRRRAFRWILALALLRRKVLRLDGIDHSDGSEVWAFRPRGAPEGASAFRIVNPGIRDQEMAELAEQLSDVIRPD